MKLRFDSRQAKGVLPIPTKGSKTISFSFVEFSINAFGNDVIQLAFLLDEQPYRLNLSFFYLADCKI